VHGIRDQTGSGSPVLLPGTLLQSFQSALACLAFYSDSELLSHGGACLAKTGKVVNSGREGILATRVRFS